MATYSCQNDNKSLEGNAILEIINELMQQVKG